MTIPILMNRKFLFSLPFWMIFPGILLLVYQIIGFNGLYGQDSYEYLRYSRSIHDFLNGGDFPGKFFWPILYPLSGALLSYLLPDILAMQLISLVSFGLTLHFLHKILQILFPDYQPDIAHYVLLFFGLSPFALRYASCVMSEPMALFFITAFFYCYLLYTQKMERKYFLLIVSAGFAAINTRYPAFVVLVIPAMHAFYLFIRKFQFLTFLLSVLIVILIFLPNFIMKVYQLDSVFGQTHFAQWSLSNFFRNSFQTDSGYLSYTFPNICFVFSSLIYPGYIFAGSLFLILFRFRTLKIRFIQIILAVFVFYTLFLAGITFQNNRVLLLSFPCIIILFSDTFLYISDYLKKWGQGYRTLIYATIIIIQSALFYRAFYPFYNDSLQTKHIAVTIQNYPGKLLYTSGIDMALKAYQCDNKFVNLWESKIQIFEPNSLVLFNIQQFKVQWKGMNPMINWENMNRQHQLKLIEKMEGGWNLYEITN